MRAVVRFVVVLSLLMPVSASADDPILVPPGCDPGRPAIAHRADGVVLDPQPDGGPVACGMRTGYPGGETRIEVLPDGTVMYAPAHDMPEPQTTMHGRGGVAVSHDQGGTWTRKLPLGVTWHMNDLETHVDRDTGRFFFGVMFKNGPGQIPNDPDGSNPVGEMVDSDGLPGSHLYEVPEGSPSTEPNHLAATPAFITTSHILTSPDAGETWTYATTCCEIVNGAAIITAPAPAGTEEPSGYPNVVYYCWRASQTFHSRPPEGICSRSLDGGASFQIRGWNHRPAVPVHGDVCPTPGSITASPDENSETGGLPQAAPDGTLYMVLVCGGNAYLTRSSDQAATWPVVVSLPHPGELRIDPDGNMYLMRALVEPHRLLLSYSTDGGTTWSDERNVTAPGVTYFENERTAIYGGRSCCTNWFYDVRSPGHVAVAYSGRRDDQGTEVHGYITETRNALDDEPVFWSATVNDPARPLKFFNGFPRGANGSTGPQPGAGSGLGGPQTNQVGMDIGPEGSPWASFTEDCGPSPDSPGCVEQNGQTRGFAGRLAWL